MDTIRLMIWWKKKKKNKTKYSCWTKVSEGTNKTGVYIS